MYVEDSQLNKFILDSGLVSKADLDTANKEAEKKGVRIGELLVGKGKITEDNLRRMQAYVLGIPFVDLKTKKIPFETLSLIPEPVARTHNIVAYKKSDEGLEVAMLDVQDLSAIDFIKKKVNLKDPAAPDRRRFDQERHHPISKEPQGRVRRHHSKGIGDIEDDR